ncbi:MAG: signal peptidase I, partial [Candidatus Omnitrophica bacterium]|nr:signal peptidase I [Candidatus Omnitrophota bacterium]
MEEQQNLASIKEQRNARIKSVAREWIESIVIAFVLAMVIRTFFIQAFRIPSGSMRMTLIEGDRILVNKLRYGPKIPLTSKRLPGYSYPHRGDVVVFVYPGDQKRDFIKRLIAIGGEEVEIRDGDIYVNGELVTIPQVKNNYYYNRGDHGTLGQKIKVPLGYYYVLGDNSGSS